MALNEKQLRFVEEYLVDLNATQAAMRAGYSAKTANEQGSQLLAKLSIQEEIQKRVKERSERTGITSDMVVNELALIAFSDLKDFIQIDKEGAIKMRHFKKLPAGATRLLKKLKEKSVVLGDASVDEGDDTAKQKQLIKVSKEIELHDKLKALELLGRHLGMFDKKLSEGGNGGEGDPNKPDPVLDAISSTAATDWADD